MKLVVGLGNPGKSYENTRHNVGFKVVDELVRRWGSGAYKSKFESLYSEIMLEGQKIAVLKPQTYMNLSGNAVYKATSFFKINVTDITIVHDDLDLDFGKIKTKHSGSDAGHKGLKSIIKTLHSNEFDRVRVGIGHPDHAEEVADYVLRSFYPEQLKFLSDLLDDCCNAVEMIILQGLTKTANFYNGKNWAK